MTFNFKNDFYVMTIDTNRRTPIGRQPIGLTFLKLLFVNSQWHASDSVKVSTLLTGQKLISIQF